MMHAITVFQHFAARKLQSLNSKLCVVSSNPGCFTVYVDDLSPSAGGLQPNGTEKTICTHRSKIKRMVLTTTA